MKALDRIKNLETFSGLSCGEYDVTYTYDEKDRITSQVSTGSLISTVTYEYDEQDNIVKETQDYVDKNYVKTYTYENGKIKSINVVVTSK